MNHLSRISAFALSVAVLGLVIAGCQPQGVGSPASQETTEAAAVEPQAAVEPTNVISAEESAQVMTVAEMSDLLVGNTIIGSSEAWNMTWSEYFAPDGTARALMKFEGQDDLVDVTGAHYFNSNGQFCTDYPDAPDGPYCKFLLPLGDGKYAQVYDGGIIGDIYEQILEGNQVDAFK